MGLGLRKLSAPKSYVLMSHVGELIPKSVIVRYYTGINNEGINNNLLFSNWVDFHSKIKNQEPRQPWQNIPYKLFRFSSQIAARARKEEQLHCQSLILWS